MSEELKEAIAKAAANISAFHTAQIPRSVTVETAPGIICEQRPVPVSRVGLYIPGGNSPLFSTVLMLALPAKIAGCPEVVLCTPPRPDGSVHPAILYAAHLAGVDRIFKTGGAQAIAAMTFGSASVAARRQDIRTRQPLCHRGKAAGARRGRSNRTAGGTVGSARDCRWECRPSLCCG